MSEKIIDVRARPPLIYGPSSPISCWLSPTMNVLQSEGPITGI